jgi:hypothetical protein
MNILDATEPTGGAGGGKFSFQVGANGLEGHKIEHTLDKLTFGDSTGTAAFASAIAAKKQTSTLTIGGTYKTGDVINININDASAQYTVKESDTIDADPKKNIEAIVAGIKSVLDGFGENNKFSGLTTAIAGADKNTITNFWQEILDVEFTD